MRPTRPVPPPSPLRRRAWALLVLGVLLLAPAPPADAAMHPQIREGWLVGIGLGGGTAGLDVPGASVNRESGFAFSVRAGYAFTPQLSLELDATAWTKEESGSRITFSSSGATLAFYPGEQGLVLRAGVGLGNGEASTRVGSTTVSASENGLGVLGGIGYEFRVTPRFSLGPQIHAAWIDLDSFNANWVNFELGFHWYFIRR